MLQWSCFELSGVQCLNSVILHLMNPQLLRHSWLETYKPTVVQILSPFSVFLTGSCSSWQTRSASLQQPLRKPHWTRCSSSPASRSAEWLMGTARRALACSTTAARGWRRAEATDDLTENTALTTPGYFCISSSCSSKWSGVTPRLILLLNYTLFRPSGVWAHGFVRYRINDHREEQRCVSKAVKQESPSGASWAHCRQQMAAGILSSFNVHLYCL